MLVPFATGSHKGRSLVVDTERLVNLYPELDESGKSLVALYGTPGLELLGSIDSRPARGMRVLGERLYAVFGNSLKRIRADGQADEIGILDTTIGAVVMADNDTEIMLVDGLFGYIWNTSTETFERITDADFAGLGAPQWVTFQDGFFIVVFGSLNWAISNHFDGLSWDASEVAQAERDPDPLRAVISDSSEVWLFGDRTIEVWFNAGGADFPFSPVSGAVLQWGIAAPQSLAQFDNSIAWLAQQPRDGAIRVMRATGYQPTRISSTALEVAMDGYGTVADAVAYSYSTGGHTFYVLTFPSASATWVYDAATGEWHERSSAGGRHFGLYYANLLGQHVVSDYRNGRLYRLKEDVYTDNGVEIRAEATGRHIHDGERVLRHRSLEIVMETGVGLQTGQGRDPQIMMRHSKDGGRTYSPELWRSFGPVGEYRQRAKWHRLGAARDRTYQIAITDPVPRKVVGMVLGAA